MKRITFLRIGVCVLTALMLLPLQVNAASLSKQGTPNLAKGEMQNAVGFPDIPVFPSEEITDVYLYFNGAMSEVFSIPFSGTFGGSSDSGQHVTFDIFDYSQTNYQVWYRSSLSGDQTYSAYLGLKAKGIGTGNYYCAP